MRVFALLSCLMASTWALDNGLAQLPPMGYSTWNDMQCEISEEKIKKVVGILHDKGFRDLGYEYINIDDCWMSQKRQSSDRGDELVGSPERFPSGMRAMGDFIHSKGFKYGLYTSRGSHTCQGGVFPGSLGHEEVDANSFAEWGVDFVKNDGCFDTQCFGTLPCGKQDRKQVLDKYARLRDALNSTGRPILYEMCGWEPWYAPPGSGLSNMFRVGADVQKWSDVYESTQLVHALGQHSKPGGWVHPDMLLGSTVGAGFHITPVQSRAQFTLWSVFPAPLMLGAKVTGMSDWDVKTYTNHDVIAVNQDAAGRFGKLIHNTCTDYAGEGFPAVLLSSDGFSKVAVKSTKDSVEEPWDRSDPFHVGLRIKAGCAQAWAKPLSNGDLAVALVNFGPKNVSFDLPQSSLPEDWRALPSIQAYDLWKRASVADIIGDFKIDLEASGGHTLLRLSKPVKPTSGNLAFNVPTKRGNLRSYSKVHGGKLQA